MASSATFRIVSSANPTHSRPSMAPTSSARTNTTEASNGVEKPAKYNQLYRTENGSLLDEDVCSDARLTAIYAANAAPGQQVFSYARAYLNHNSVPAQHSALMPPPLPPFPLKRGYAPDQPPSYCPPGTSLHDWASIRAESDRLHQRQKIASLSKHQKREAGGLVTAFKKRLDEHEERSARMTDFAAPCSQKQKGQFASGRRRRMSIPERSPTPTLSSSIRNGEDDVVERSVKRLKLTVGQGMRPTPTLPTTPRTTSKVPERPPTPVPQLGPFPSGSMPAPLPRQKLIISRTPPPPPRSLTPIPNSPSPRTPASKFKSLPTATPLHVRVHEPLPRGRMQVEDYERPADEPPLQSSKQILTAEYIGALKSWDEGMQRTLPGYRKSEERREWYLTRFDGPKRFRDEEKKPKKKRTKRD